MQKIKILNVEFDNITKEEVLRSFDRGLLCTPNVDVMMNNQRVREYHEAYGKSALILCDSRILGLCSKLLPVSFKEVIPGSSFFSDFYMFHKDNPGIRIFLLGGLEGVADKAKERINEKVGREIVVGTYSPPFGFEKDDKECQHIIDLVDASGATVLMTGISDPKQTIWHAKYMDKFKTARMFMALGATIDFEAGNIKRAPIIFQKLALEWLFRFFCDPKRLYKRYFIDDPKFFWLFAKQLIGLYKNPFEPKGQGNRG